MYSYVKSKYKFTKMNYPSLMKEQQHNTRNLSEFL